MRPRDEVEKKDESEGLVRLQVLLARSGLGSRRACEEFITDGRVTVDGEIVTELGVRVARGQKVLVDGEGIRAERTVYYLANKPAGVLCTNEDPNGRPRVIDMFPRNAGRLYPVGRLDEETTGLLLVTNDGDLSYQLAHPKFRVPKKYHVHVAGTPTWEQLEELRRGMYFSDGKFKVEGIRQLKTKGRSAILEVVLSEGQNREIRRLFARIGHKVIHLERVGIGPLKLSDMPPGAYRPLTATEVKKLHEYLATAPEARADFVAPKPAAPRKKAARPVVVAQKPGPTIVEVTAANRRGNRDITGQRVDRAVSPFHPAIEVEAHADSAVGRQGRPTANRHPAIEKRPATGRPAIGNTRGAQGTGGTSRTGSGRPANARGTGGGPKGAGRRKR